MALYAGEGGFIQSLAGALNRICVVLVFVLEPKVLSCRLSIRVLLTNAQFFRGSGTKNKHSLMEKKRHIPIVVYSE